MSVITSIVKYMWEYQKLHDISDMCITNTAYLHDQIISNGMFSKAKAVIMTSIKSDEELVVVGGHLVLQIDEDDDELLVDASYDCISMPRAQYFDNITLLLKAYPMLKTQQELLKKTITMFMEFKKYESWINDKDLCPTTYEEYYHKQADYVEAKLKSEWGT